MSDEAMTPEEMAAQFGGSVINESAPVQEAPKPVTYQQTGAAVDPETAAKMALLNARLESPYLLKSLEGKLGTFSGTIISWDNAVKKTKDGVPYNIVDFVIDVDGLGQKKYECAVSKFKVIKAFATPTKFLRVAFKVIKNDKGYTEILPM